MRTVLTDTQVFAEHILAIIARGKHIWREIILVKTAWADIEQITFEIMKQNEISWTFK